jgi:uncharacterized protein YbjT (DUF2867 family)
MNIAVTGANSSVGNILLRHLAGHTDIHVVACVRSARAAAALPASPRISPRIIDYDDREALAAALTAACVVHLAGILIESATSGYQAANVDATLVVVNACKAAGVPHLVLVSVLGANPDSPNRYLRSKALAERIVAESNLSAATIIRTPILLGPGTAGARAIVDAASQGTATLLGGGRHTIRPLDVDDLSRAIVRCCRAPRAGVAVYELVGPEAVTYRDVVVRTAALMGRDVSIRTMPVWLAKLGAAVAGLKRQGGMTPTVVEVITSNEAVEKNADVELGITLSPLSATLEKLLPAQANVWRR